MATRAEIEKLNVEKLKDFVSSQLNGEVLENGLESLVRNRVSGKTFFLLDDDELRELFPLIGERKAVRRLINAYNPKKQVWWTRGRLEYSIDYGVPFVSKLMTESTFNFGDDNIEFLWKTSSLRRRLVRRRSV